MDPHIEQQLFEIKSKFLRHVPHPRLIRKSIEQVKALAGTDLVEFESEQPSYSDVTLTHALTAATEDLLKLKLAISGSETASELYANLIALYNLHWALLARLASYLPVLNEYPDHEIKQSDPVDSYETWRFISRAGLSENEIKPYICKAISGRAPADFDELTIACLRSRKIILNA